MNKSNTQNPTIDQVVAETIDTVKAAAVAQGIIPEQQAADRWVINFDDIAHIPNIHTMSDDDFFALRDTYSRYVSSKLFLRDNTGKLTDDMVASLTDIVRRYDTEGHDMVENCYRASIVAAVAGGASLLTVAGVAASSFVVGLTGSVMFANMAAVGLIFTAALGVFKFGNELRELLRWISDRLASAVNTVCDWVAAGWQWLMDTINNVNATADAK